MAVSLVFVEEPLIAEGQSNLLRGSLREKVLRQLLSEKSTCTYQKKKFLAFLSVEGSNVVKLVRI